ncbi:hypothetical protein ACIQUW_32905 [Streptomyces sp. NPDC101117]|uniref:hypothetical protein n=1 Tax=Streptomyces sp. NPDC101117 TaxID=3366108 RepID=UPI00381D6C2A
MNEQWPVVFAAIAGVAGTVTVAGISILGNRRQTRDQAHVEHGQWLRDQRQQAYADLFTAWDTAVKELQAFQYGWQQLVERNAEADEGYQPWFLVEEKLNEVWPPLRQAIERCELLGPNVVNEAAHGLYDGWRPVREALEAQAHRSPSEADWEVWKEALGKAAVGRINFHVACMKALRTPPGVEVERLW